MENETTAQRICELKPDCEEEAVAMCPYVFIYDPTGKESRFAWGCERHLAEKAEACQPIVEAYFEGKQ